VEPSLVIAVTKEKNNMAMPAGIQKKTKDNSKKKYREHDEWMEGKKLGRPKQVFNPETKTWSKVVSA
jgi:hypothetical protein